jgi:hypothetical protein
MNYNGEDEMHNINDNRKDQLIYDVENLILEIENDIRKLWDNVIIYYINNHKCQILDKLTEHDYTKFFDFMIKNCKPYQSSLNYLRILNVKK